MGEQHIDGEFRFWIDQLDKIKEKLADIDKQYFNCRLLIEKLEALQKDIDEIKEAVSVDNTKTTLEKIITILSSLLSLIMASIALYKTLHLH